MGHSHTGRSEQTVLRVRGGLALTLAIVVGALSVAVGIAMALLWPNAADIPHQSGPFDNDGVSLVSAEVTHVAPFGCEQGQQGDPGDPGADPGRQDAYSGTPGDCARVLATVDDGSEAEFTMDATRFAATDIAVGDDVRLIRIAQGGGADNYEFSEFQRGPQLLVIGLAFALLVALIGRLRGVLAILGVGVAVAVLALFVLPAILAGTPPLLAAIVGSTAIMIVVLYLAHGPSVRTTAALFGSIFGILATAGIGALTTSWSRLTGVGTEDDWMLFSSAPSLDMSAVVTATMVIAGLGVLNDITITQVSAVWEMRALTPEASPRRIFASAMRIGRDHVASSIYTLVFAYAGSVLAMLLLLYTYPQNPIDLLTTEQISQEVVRTLVGAAGLVLAMPVTTAIAIAFVRGAYRPAHAA